MRSVYERLSSHTSLCAALTAASLVTSNPGLSIFNGYKSILGDLAKASATLATLPFTKGDRVTISSFSGTVSSISPRYVSLDNPECTIYIPTHILYTSIIMKHK